MKPEIYIASDGTEHPTQTAYLRHNYLQQVDKILESNWELSFDNVLLDWSNLIHLLVEWKHSYYHTKNNSLTTQQLATYTKGSPK